MKGVGGTDLVTSINWGTTHVKGKSYETWAGTEYPIVRTLNSTLSVIRDITLPTGLKYQFEYNADSTDPNDSTKSVGLGELSKVTLPTGAFVQYDFTMNGVHGSTAAPLEMDTILDSFPNQKHQTYVDSSNVSHTDTWTYNRLNEPGQPATYTSITAPDGSVTTDYRSSGLSFATIGPDGSMTERLYQANLAPNSTYPDIPYLVNSVVKTEFSSVPNPSGTPTITAIKDYSYDKNGNVTNTRVYDYVPYSSIPRDSHGRITGLPDASVLSSRLKSTTENTYCDTTVDSSDTTSNPSNAYWNASSPKIKGAAYVSEVKDPNSQTIARSETFFDANSALGTMGNASIPGYGNPTKVRTWESYRNGVFQALTTPLTDSNSKTVISQYDQYGQLTKVWDSSGDTNRFVETIYDSTYQLFPIKVRTPAPDPSGAHGTTETSEVNAAFDFYTGLTTSVTDEFGQTTATQYDSYSRPYRVYATNFTAPEAQTIYGVPDQTGHLPSTQRFVTVRKQLDANNWDESTSWTDELGRTIKTQAKDSQGDVFVETHYDNMGRVDRATSPYRVGDTVYWSKTRYDIAGRAVEAFAPATQAQIDYTETNHDYSNLTSLGTTSFDVSTFNTTGNFYGTVVTTVDASLRPSRSITNALGQLLRVDEPTIVGNSFVLGNLDTPNQATYYKYDFYGKMVQVIQGVQNRYFKYDSLGRLLRVNQPEQEYNSSLDLADSFNTDGHWTAGFVYDILGNVVRATDAKGINIINDYDKASRVVKRCYSTPNTSTMATTCAQLSAENKLSGDTPTVEFWYDGKGLASTQTPYNYAKGKLTKVDNGISATEYMTFDNFGRLTRTRQITDGTIYGDDTHPMTYIYNLSGALVQETYPSGRVVKNEFESDGDLQDVVSKKAGGTVFTPYVSNFSYTASGGISQMKLGNGKWETAKFNERLQVYELGLGGGPADASLWKVHYDYGELSQDGASVDTAKNTGNIARQILTVPGTSFTQSYRYDSLYRLTEAKEPNGTSTPNWIQNWTYDRYGNRNSFTQNLAGNTNATNPGVDQNTNRFTSTDFVYDKNGNVTTDKDPVANLTRTFVFNGDNKQIAVKDSNGNDVGRYFYDGEGKRVKKVTNTETTIFVYSNGKLVAEYSTQLATNPSINYTTTDHLGSPRIITNELGQVKSRRDFMPFGEELYAGVGARTGDTGLKYGATADSVRQKFTGYQKDGETSLDFAEARMYENRFGRFTAVDPLLASGKSAHPQTFNRYVYVGANPLLRTDPRGLDWFGQMVNGVITGYRWSSDNKFFDDGSSVEGWTAVEFNSNDEFYYDGCVNDDCTKKQGAVLYKGGGWDWTNSAAFTFHSLVRDELKEFTSNWNYFDKHGVSGIKRGLQEDFNYFMQDPLGERGLGNQGLAFVTGGVSQEAQLLKGLRFASAEVQTTTEATKDTVLYEQYSLRAAKDGMYPVMERGFKGPVGNIFLKEGEVWKFGQTTKGAGRYSATWLEDTGLQFIPEFKTPSFKEVLQIEKQQILEYERIFGKLPPGNKIRR